MRKPKKSGRNEFIELVIWTFLLGRTVNKQRKKEKKQTETNESEKKYARVCVKGKFEY